MYKNPYVFARLGKMFALRKPYIGAVRNRGSVVSKLYCCPAISVPYVLHGPEAILWKNNGLRPRKGDCFLGRLWGPEIVTVFRASCNEMGHIVGSDLEALFTANRVFANGGQAEMPMVIDSRILSFIGRVKRWKRKHGRAEFGLRRLSCCVVKATLTIMCERLQSRVNSLAQKISIL